jgi:hypothetical protein
MGKDQPNYKVHINELGEKKDQPKDPLMGVNGRLNKKQIALRVMIKKKMGVVEHKRKTKDMS